MQTYSLELIWKGTKCSNWSTLIEQSIALTKFTTSGGQ